MSGCALCRIALIKGLRIFEARPQAFCMRIPKFCFFFNCFGKRSVKIPVVGGETPGSAEASGRL